MDDIGATIRLTNPAVQSTPKTIQIFLPGGDPHGIRIAEITTRIVQVLEVPRSLLGQFLAMEESRQVALYFLVGQAEDASEPRVYVGQTGDLRARLTTHNKDKDFWERVLVLISRTHSLTQTHALFLEWHCLQAIARAARYVEENGNGGSKPHTPAPLEADCIEIFDTGRTLLATLGYPIFDPVAKPAAQAENSEEFFCKGPSASARGHLHPGGLRRLSRLDRPAADGRRARRHRHRGQPGGPAAGIDQIGCNPRGGRFLRLFEGSPLSLAECSGVCVAGPQLQRLARMEELRRPHARRGEAADRSVTP